MNEKSLSSLKEQSGGGGFICSKCSPLFGEDSHFDTYFSDELKPPTSLVYCLKMNMKITVYMGPKVYQDPF